MLKPVWRFSIRAALTAGMVFSPAAPALAADPPAGDPPVDVDQCAVNVICTGTGHNGTTPKPGGGGGGGGGGGTGGPQLCEWNGELWPCSDPVLGWFSGSTGCYYLLDDPQPEAGDPVWEGHKPEEGQIYSVTCRFPGGGIGSSQPQFFAQAPVQPAPANPQQIADWAFKKIVFPFPEPGFAPKGAAVVGAPVWLWLDQTKGPTVPGPQTASSGGVSVTVTPKLEAVEWDLEESNVVCRTPGTPYRAEFGARPSPDCGHVFKKGSAVKPDGLYSGTVRVRWRAEVKVTGSSQTVGDKFMVLDSKFDLKVAEVQVLN